MRVPVKSFQVFGVAAALLVLAGSFDHIQQRYTLRAICNDCATPSNLMSMAWPPSAPTTLSRQSANACAVPVVVPIAAPSSWRCPNGSVKLADPAAA